jgi:hypothetical protein
MRSSSIRLIRVQTRCLGGAQTQITVCVPRARATVAQLIRGKIRTEWEAGGIVGRESVPLETPAARWASVDDAIRNALDAYRAGWYVIQVDGEQPGGLDTVLSLSPESSVVFIRLYPLMDG